MIAAYRGTGYDIVLLLHILTAFVAFAPAFVHPLIARQTAALDATAHGRVLGMIAGFVFALRLWRSMTPDQRQEAFPYVLALALIQLGAGYE